MGLIRAPVGGGFTAFLGVYRRNGMERQVGRRRRRRDRLRYVKEKGGGGALTENVKSVAGCGLDEPVWVDLN